jgi:hypothetical protein
VAALLAAPGATAAQAAETALHAPDEAPRPYSPGSLAPSPGPSIAAWDTAAPDVDAIGSGDPDPEQEDAVPAVPAVIAVGAGEAWIPRSSD